MTQSNDSSNPKKHDQLDRESLERTIPLSGLAPDEKKPRLDRTIVDPDSTVSPGRYLERTHRETATDDPSVTNTDITEFVHDTQFPADLLLDPARTGKRYAIEGVIGKGATGRIFAMRDNGLGRTVAVKLLDKKRERKKGRKGQFVHEARVTATLEHPNIMPVHDIGMSEHGELYFTMKNVAGCSLGEAIKATRQNTEVHPEFATIDGCVRIFLKVCDALSYAHSRGYIHQDIKPDNIMLGEHGEVLLLDWGSALSKQQIDHTDGPGLVGTPAYMSPEQARREKSDERSDVYCLGATLFHALLFRHPTWADNPEAFWEKKRAGKIDPPSPDEQRRIPMALVDIAVKALRAEPAKRYQSIAEMAEDLKRYQAGCAVSAHRDSVLELVGRWYRHNVRVFWISLVALIGIGAIGSLLFRERIEELMTWDLLFTEDFSYEHTGELATAWEYHRSDDWVEVREVPFADSGGWYVDSGVLIGESRTGFDNITFKRRLPGDIRVEWEVTPLRKNLNLNCYIAGETRLDGYTFHLGGWNSPTNFVLTKGNPVQVLDHFMHSEGLELGQTYRFRMEKEGAHVRLYLDGAKLFDYKDLVHLSGVGHQTFGFENCAGNRIRLDNVKVYYHPLPLKVSPLVAADRYYQKGHFAEAREQYREIYQTYPDNQIAPLAFFSAARCLIGMDSLGTALQELWLFRERYPDHELVPLSLYERAGIYERRGSGDVAESFYRSIAERHPGHPVSRTILFNMTNERFRRLDSLVVVSGGAWDSAFYERLNRDRRSLQAWAREFGASINNNPFLERLPTYLRVAYPLDSIIAWLPNQRHAIAKLLNDLGHYERVVTRYGEQDEAVAEALMGMGQFRRVITEYSHIRNLAAGALYTLGRYDEIIEHYRDQRYYYGNALLGKGRYEEVLNGFHDNPSLRRQAARVLGKQRTLFEDPNTTLLQRLYLMLEDLGYYDSALTIIESRKLQRRKLTHYGILYRTYLLASGRPRKLLRLYGDSLTYVHQCAQALHAMGRDDEILRRYARFKEPCIMAHQARGEYDSVLTNYPDHWSQGIESMRKSGRLREVYERYPRRPALRARVLLELGEYGKVVDEYPDQTDEAAYALLALGRYDELLRRYPHEHTQCRNALIAKGVAIDSIMRIHPGRRWMAEELYKQGRYDEVVGEYVDVPYWYSLALIRTGRLEQIPWKKGDFRLTPRDNFMLTCDRALLEAIEGDYRRADSLLALPLYFSYEWESSRFLRFLLKPLLSELGGNQGAVSDACEHIMNRHRFHYQQRLWYEAAFLAGRISADEFKEQPYRQKIQSRLAFLQALRSDLAGRSEQAIRQYTITLSFLKFNRDNLVDRFTVREFMQWRIRILSAET